VVHHRPTPRAFPSHAPSPQSLGLEVVWKNNADCAHRHCRQRLQRRRRDGLVDRLWTAKGREDRGVGRIDSTRGNSCYKIINTFVIIFMRCLMLFTHTCADLAFEGVPLNSEIRGCSHDFRFECSNVFPWNDVSKFL